MKILRYFLFALTGLLGGLLTTVGFSFLWMSIIPIEDRVGEQPGFWSVLAFILALVALPALTGGLIGGRLPKEGGPWPQYLYAAIFGALFSLPFACFLFWVTGW